jgi:3-deoxy-D-manno-octulosonic-acid transferase
LIALLLVQRYLSGKSRSGWSERWGHLDPRLHAVPGGRPRIWVHAVSVGEVVAAVPILRELRALLGDHEILLSVITPAGREMAEQQAAAHVDGIFYFPFDLPWVARRVATAIRPSVFVSLESELWPNVLHEAKRAGASTVMVNGRISERNFRRARRFGGGLFRWMLGNLDRMLVQSQADADRIRTLGLAARPGAIEVVGNSKFDQEIPRLSHEEVCALRAELGLPAGAQVFIAGSTRSREEEAEVIGAYVTLRSRFPDLCLLIAPRHIERAEELAAAMRRAGLAPVRRTELKAGGEPVRHLILDTIGELARVYAVGAVAFVGNSFGPVVKGGGQNPIQPLAHGLPVIVGPRIATIRSEAALAIEAGLGFQVQSGAELAEVAAGLLADPDRLAEIDSKARALVEANRGVSARYARHVAELARNRASAGRCIPAAGNAAGSASP